SSTAGTRENGSLSEALEGGAQVAEEGPHHGLDRPGRDAHPLDPGAVAPVVGVVERLVGRERPQHDDAFEVVRDELTGQLVDEPRRTVQGPAELPADALLGVEVRRVDLDDVTGMVLALVTHRAGTDAPALGELTLAPRERGERLEPLWLRLREHL